MKRLAACAGLVLAFQAWADHPLITEDTEVLGKGGWQAELHGDRARDEDTRGTQVSGVLSYGFAEKADVQGEVSEGRGDASIAAGYELARFQLLGDFGYLRNRNGRGERQSLWHASAAVLFAATENLKLVLDEDIDLGVGLQKGLSDPADDRALRAGLKFRW